MPIPLSPRVARTALSRYGVACAAVLTAFLLKRLLGVTEEAPFLLLFSAVMITAWNGGIGPGLLATILAVLAADYCCITPGRILAGNTPGQNSRLLLFALEGLLVSWLSGLLHGARQRAKASAVEARGYQDSLLQAEAQFRLLVEGVKDYAIFMLDSSGSVMTWTEAAQRMTGYEANQVIGRPFNCLVPIPEGDEAADSERGNSLRTALLQGRSEQELWCVRKDGSRFWADIVVAVLRDPNGEPRGYATVVRDMTEWKRAEELRRQREEASAEVSRLKDDFLALVSHELRQPLNSILGWSQLLRRGKLDEEGRAQAVDTIEQSAKAQNRLIADLLDVSGMISGKMRLDTTTLQLAAPVEAAIDSVRAAADAKGVRIESDVDPQAGTVSGDRSRLQQVTWNLLSNAVKFTPRGGVVRVQLGRVNSYVQLVVEDTGAGIAPSFLPHLFEPFRQADVSSTRRYKGLGMGLAIVKNLVELHGGTVEADSPGEGHGTTIRVVLPLAASHTIVRTAPVTQSHWQPNESVNSTHALSGLRVLVVDDEAPARVLLTTLLKASGAEVSVAASAAEALAAVESFKPDVLVSDIEMPGEDGFALIRHVRELAPEQGGMIPALAVTGYARPEDRDRALAAGFQVHLAKPVEPEKLTAAVQDLAEIIHPE